MTKMRNQINKQKLTVADLDAIIKDPINKNRLELGSPTRLSEMPKDDPLWEWIAVKHKSKDPLERTMSEILNRVLTNKQLSFLLSKSLLGKYTRKSGTISGEDYRKLLAQLTSEDNGSSFLKCIKKPKKGFDKSGKYFAGLYTLGNSGVISMISWWDCKLASQIPSKYASRDASHVYVNEDVYEYVPVDEDEYEHDSVHVNKYDNVTNEKKLLSNKNNLLIKKKYKNGDLIQEDLPELENDSEFINTLQEPENIFIPFKTGMKVKCIKAEPYSGIFSGDICEVIEVDFEEENMFVKIQQGHTEVLPLENFDLLSEY